MQKIFWLIPVFSITAIQLNAQDISAPYSTFGIGDINNKYFDRSSGMANTSLAIFSSPGYLLTKNPASLTGLDRSFLQVDLSIVGKSLTYAGNTIDTGNNKGRDMTVKSLALSIKLNNHWASSLNVLPFSYVGYLYSATKSIEGSVNTYTGLYEGDGGLYNVGWSNAYSLGKHFSVGIRSSFIFGSINQTETLQSESLTSPVVSTTKDYYNHLRFEYGAIYSGKITKNWKLAFGGKFIPQTSLNTERTLTSTEGTTTIDKEKVLSTGQYHLPASYGAGIALTHKEHSTFSVDFTMDKWDGVKNPADGFAMVNSNRISGGIQIVNKKEQFGRSWEKNFIQAGVFYNQSYLQVHKTQITEFGLSAGYGGFLNGGLVYNLALEAGRRGTTINGLIRENYVQFTIALSYREFLFSKGRKYN
jgi:hypothetical protein